jgi:hypothetical protein
MMAATLCVILFVGTAAAQTNIGELLDAGGKALTKDEVLATFRGATVSGKTTAGGETVSELKDNGTISGYLTNATGRRGAVFGTWTANDSGKFCRDITIRFYESSQIKDCYRIYRLGDQYYVPATASDERSVSVLKRTITH